MSSLSSSPLLSPRSIQSNEQSAWEQFKALPRSSQIKIALGVAAVAIPVIAAVGAAGAGLTGAVMAFAGNPVGLQVMGYSVAGLFGTSAVALTGSKIAKSTGIEEALKRAWENQEEVQETQNS